MLPPSPADPPPPEPSPATHSLGLRTSEPSILQLVRLSPNPVFPPGGEDLYRQIGRLTEMEPGQSVIDSACGRGISTSFLASTFGVEGHGLDPDPTLIADAEQRARDGSGEARLHYQCAPLDDLPYRDGIFDVALGEVGLGIAADPALAIRELARVTRPMGRVALVQLTWIGNLEPERRERLASHLGARPLFLMEWKQLMRDAGIVDLHVEDWTNQGTASPSGSPFHDMAQIFTLRQRMGILRRALRRWGWKGVRGAMLREQEIHDLLTRQRLLGLSLIVGTRWHTDVAEAS
jgi:SAM-dependent methyltransferase